MLIILVWLGRLRSNCSALIPPGTPGNITFFVVAPPFFITSDFFAPPLSPPSKLIHNMCHSFQISLTSKP